MAVVFRDPAADLAVYLADQTPTTYDGWTPPALVSGRNLIARRLPHPMPQGNMVNLLNGDAEPQPYVNGSAPKAFVPAQVQVLVYGMPGADGMRDGQRLAYYVAGLLQQVTGPVFVALSLPLVGSRCLGLPVLAGEDKANRPVWTFQVQVSYTT